MYEHAKSNLFPQKQIYLRMNHQDIVGTIWRAFLSKCQTIDIFTIGFYFYIGLLIIINTLLACILSLAVRNEQHREILFQKIVARCVAHVISLNTGWQVSYEGIEKIHPGESYIIVANHQSVIDPFLLFALPIYFKLVAKEWVFKFPLIGLVLKLSNHILAGQGMTLFACRKQLNSGTSIVIFPEGTRSSDGSILPFKKGAFLLSVMSGARILPIVIDGGRQVLPKHSRTLGQKAIVKIYILDPVHPSEFNWKVEQLHTHMQAIMKACLNDLRDSQSKVAFKVYKNMQL